MISDTNQLDYMSGPGSGADNQTRFGGLPLNKLGLQSLKKRKMADGLHQLPPLNQPLNLLQSNNSIQAIDVSNQNIASGDLADFSPDKDDNNLLMKTKKRRKKVWIPAESFRKIGL
jgi:hypothetical protein